MRTLRLHDTGPDVSELQRMLTAAGFPCEPDADFGPKTLDAVKAFQAAHGLDPDGVAGSRTVAALEALAPTDPPPAPEIWGVDVSESNTKIPVDALVAGGCSFAILRATTGNDRDGVMRKDALFDQHRRTFERAKIPVIGAYGWFSEVRDGVEQGELLVRVTEDLGGFASVDYEPAPSRVGFRDPERASREAAEMIATVLDARKECPIYTGPWALASAPLIGLEAQPLWLSHFGRKAWPPAPAPWKAVTLWQQKIALIGGVEIDKNFYRGTLDELCRVMGGA